MILITTAGQVGSEAALTHHRPGKGILMATTTDNPGRTAHLLALMKQGDDAFNSQNIAAMNAVHHPDMIAHIPGSAEPIRGRAAHAAAMEQFFRIFPDVRVHNDPYPIQFGSGDWITVISRTTGTFSGEMALPDGTVIPPTGKASTSSSARPSGGTATRSSRSSPPGTTARQAQQIGLA